MQIKSFQQKAEREATTVETEFVELWKWLVFGYQMRLEFDRILTVPLAGSIRVIQVFPLCPLCLRSFQLKSSLSLKELG